MIHVPIDYGVYCSIKLKLVILHYVLKLFAFCHLCSVAKFFEYTVPLFTIILFILGGKEDPGSPTGSEDVEVKSKPSKLDGMLDGSLRSSRSATPTPAISIEPDGSLELTEDMINGMDNEVIKSDTLQSAKARGSNNTGLGVIIPSDDESVDGEALLLLGEEEEGEEPEGQTEEQVDVGGVAAVGGEGGGAGGGGGEKGAEGMAKDALPGSTPKRGRGVSQTSEEERGHDHERTPQPSDHQERTLEPVKVPLEQKNTDQNGPPTDNVSHARINILSIIKIAIYD